MIKYFGSLCIHYDEGEHVERLWIYSYNHLIGYAFRYIQNKNVVAVLFDKRYYSITTRKHQAIAYSILNTFRTFWSKDIYLSGIMFGKSLRDLRTAYGYTPLKQQIDNDEIGIIK